LSRAHRTLHQLREESGIAVPIVLAVMMVVLALSAAAVLAATANNDLAGRDANQKAALEAADAGLRAATYRLNMLLPQQGYCPTNPATQVGGSGLCAQDGPENLGNGDTFSYWVSDVLGPGAQCAGLPVTAPSGLNPQTVGQRCITAIGTANTGAPNAVSAHVQIRVASYTAQAVFSVPGLIGLNEVTIAANALVNGWAGTNKDAYIGNNANVTGVDLGPPGTLHQGNNSHVGAVTRQSPSQGPIGLPLPSFGNTASVNDDSRIGAPNSSTVNCSSPPSSSSVDTCTGVSWSDTASDPRDLSLGPNATLTLGGGVYNFCNFSSKPNVTIKIPYGTYTTIYIDSPNDPNSAGDTGTKCAAGTGSFTLGNNAQVTVQTTDPANPGVADPTALKIFVYGNPTSPASNKVTWSNNTNSFATIVAPFSSVELSNNGAFTGAVGGYNLDLLNNFTFNWYAKESSLLTGQQDLYYRTAWEQCPALGFNPATPTAGC